MGDAITISITVNYIRVPGDEAGPDRLTKAMRFVKETEALLLASKDMAKALLVVLQSGVNSSWIDDDTGERVDMQKMARAAIDKAGVPFP